MGQGKKWQFIRHLSQAGFVIYFAWMVFAPLFSKTGGRGMELHSICPVGALETLPTFLASGRFVREASSNNFIMLAVLLLATFAFGGAFCGWVCPVGSVSEWLFKIRKLFVRREVTIPPKIHKALSWLRYAMLAVLLLFSYMTASLWYEHADPFISIFSLRALLYPALVVMGIFVAGSLLLERFYCNYLCPMGAVIKPLAMLSPTGISRSGNSCIDCGNCGNVCPKRIDFKISKKVDRSECISCMKCIDSCSGKSALEYRIGW